MKKRLFSVFAFALAVSAGAAFVLYQLIATRVKAGGNSAPATTKVFVASHNLESGALVQEKDLRITEYLTPPSGSLTKKEDILGRAVTNPVHEDAPFYDPGLAPKGAGGGFAAIIPKGMRAFPVHVNEVVGVAGFAVAGMHVDLLVSGTPPGSGNESLGAITRTLLQNIEVLSAGQNFQKDAEGKPVLVQVVNLLVTPEQAEIVNLATDQRIQLVLRNPADHAIVQTSGAATANLFEGGINRMPKPAMTMAASPQPRTMASKAPAMHVAAVREAVVKEMPKEVTVEVYAGEKKTEAVVRTPREMR